MLRRLLEVHERQTEAFHAILLDWAKDFNFFFYIILS